MRTEYDDIRFTTNFSMGEMMKSALFPEVAAAMKPEEYHKQNMFLLAVLILQPVRTYFNMIINVDSGLRIDGLNGLVGGSTTSLHPEGKAADIYPDDRSNLRDIFFYIKDELRGRWGELKYVENVNGGFIHVALRHFGKEPFCSATYIDGSVEYFKVLE